MSNENVTEKAETTETTTEKPKKAPKAKESKPKGEKKATVPVKATCVNCGKEAYSQAFKATVTDGKRTYACRRKGGCAPTTPTAPAAAE